MYGGNIHWQTRYITILLYFICGGIMITCRWCGKVLDYIGGETHCSEECEKKGAEYIKAMNLIKQGG